MKVNSVAGADDDNNVGRFGFVRLQAFRIGALRPFAFGHARDKSRGIAPSLAGPVCTIVLNALGRLLGVEVAHRRRQRSIAEVDDRPPDDGSAPVDDEAKTSALVEECQSIAPRILIHAALAQAGDLSLAHHGLNP